MRNRLPIVYLVDSAGVNLPYQDGIFPGQYGAGRIFYYNSLMRRKLRVPQIAAVMGPCIAGGAYLPALSDVIIMVEGISFMGLGGPNLVKGATGQAIDPESLGGAHLHTAISGVAHYMAKDDADCLDAHPPARSASCPRPRPPARTRDRTGAQSRRTLRRAARRSPPALRDRRRDPRASSTRDDYIEFQPEYAPEMLCANARLCGHPVAVIANRRGFLKAEGGRASAASSTPKPRARWPTSSKPPSALGRPLIYLQDVSGFMVGPEAESEGIIRAGAEMVETMSCATVPKHRPHPQSRQRRGLLRDGRPGLRSQLHLQLAHRAHRRDGRRIGRAGAVRGGARQVQGTAHPRRSRRNPSLKRAPITSSWLDARYAAARGHCDAVIDPLESRAVLSFALEACTSPTPDLRPPTPAAGGRP